MFWSMLLDQRLSKNDSRGFSFRNSLSKLLQSYGELLDQSLSGGEKREDQPLNFKYLCFHHQGYALHVKKLASANKVTLTADHMGVLLTVSQTLDHQCYQQYNNAYRGIL